MSPSPILITTQENVPISVEFDKQDKLPYRFLVINYTGSDVKVSLTSQEELNAGIGVFKVPSETARIVGDKPTGKMWILAAEGMEDGVEIQWLKR